jgi:acetylglutamate kinase
MVTNDKEVSVNEVSMQSYGSIEALRQLLNSEGNEANILRISPKGYTISNGIDYCCVGLISKVGTDYLIHAYGKEAIALYDEATRRIS